MRTLPTDAVWTATWLLWSLAAVIAALTLPGFCHFALIPSLVAAIVSLTPLDRSVATVLLGIVSAVVIVPLVYLLLVALGPHPASLYGAVICLAWTPLYPLLAEKRRATDSIEPSSPARAA